MKAALLYIASTAVMLSLSFIGLIAGLYVLRFIADLF